MFTFLYVRSLQTCALVDIQKMFNEIKNLLIYNIIENNPASKLKTDQSINQTANQTYMYLMQVLKYT